MNSGAPGFRGLRTCLPAVGILLVLAAVPAPAEESGKTPVRDLAYGEALFEFYREDYFAAATRLLVADRQDTLKHHRDDARLLLGGLYLSYGRQDDAAGIFSELLTARAPRTANRAWLYLAEIAWQRGNTARAKTALGSMGSDLDENLAAGHSLLTARIAIDEGRFDEAIQVLHGWRGGRELLGYARFNLGVALIRQGDMQRGSRYLDQVGGGARGVADRFRRPLANLLRFGLRHDSRTGKAPNERQALRDKANLALGYAWLQHGQPERAQGYLEKVTAGSAWFTKARLGAGWAATELGHHADAVQYWEALQQLDHLDPAVQEALLAIPYARNSMGKEALALSQYQLAITQFETEIANLSQFEDELNQGEFLQTLLSDNATGSAGWFWRIRNLPDSTTSRYLYHLIADHGFQEGLKNYRDLAALKRNLENWRNNLTTYEDMLDARQQRYLLSMERQRNGTEQQQLTALHNRVAVVGQQLAMIDATEDAVALATPGEQQQWQRLREIGRRLNALGTQAQPEALDKQRLLQGVLTWDFEQHYAARLWDMKKAHQTLVRTQARAEQLGQSLQVARTDTPQNFNGFQDRIKALSPRIDAQLNRVNRALNQHESYLADLAGAQFQQHRNRLVAYLAEARFAMASSFDRAARTAEPAQ